MKHGLAYVSNKKHASRESAGSPDAEGATAPVNSQANGPFGVQHSGEPCLLARTEGESVITDVIYAKRSGQGRRGQGTRG